MFAANNSFLGPILNTLENDTVWMYREKEPHEMNMEQTEKMLGWADVAFFDFCQYPFAEATIMESDTPLIARLHGLEVYRESILKANWNRVNAVIMSSPQLLRFSRLHLPYVPTIISMPIGTDPMVFNYTETKHYGTDLCMIAISTIPRKRLFTTLETFRMLLDDQDDWTLHIRAGISSWRSDEQVEYANYLDELIEILDLEGKVRVYDHLPLREFIHWLQTKDIFISNSMQEGYCKSAFDAMACGVFPLIFNWMGAESVFKNSCLFRSQAELVRKIKAWRRTPRGSKLKASKRVRAYVVRHHNEHVVGKRIHDILVDAVEN